MNICMICQGDGVLQMAGHWYCMNHLDEGFLTAAGIVYSMRTGQHDPDKIEQKVLAFKEVLEDEG